jgi:ABC-2 type transporter
MLRGGWTITRRELGHLRRDPGQLVGAAVFPAIMVLLFGYVFGSAITVPGGGGYRDYLMPGLFAMSAIAGVMASALLISKDVAEGVMDRLRSMPIARSAVPFGRTAADLLGAAVGVAIMALIALLVGWRAHNGLAATLAAFGLGPAAALRGELDRRLGGPVGHPADRRLAGAAGLPGRHALQQLRPDHRDAGLAAAARRLEPDQRAGGGLPGAVRHPDRAGRPTPASPCGIPWPRRSAGRC